MLNNLPATFFEYYFYFTILLALAVLFLVRSQSPSDPNSAINKFDLWVCGVILFFSLALKTYFYIQIPFWSDEMTQFSSANTDGAFMGAAFQQQPPIGYFLTLWSVKFFGYSEYAIRAPVILISTWGLLLFYLLLRRIGVSFGPALIVVMLFSLNPVVFQYSIEARPIIFGTVFSFWFLYELWKTIEYPEKETISQVIRVAAVSFILLNTVGFQPVVFLMAVGCLFFLGIYFSKVYVRGFCGIMLGTLFFLPIQFNIFNQSREYFDQVKPNVNFLSAVSDYFQFQMILGGLVGIFALIGLIYLKIKMKRRWQIVFQKFPIRLKLVLWLFSITGIFSLLAILIFYYFINYNIKPRYLLIGLSPLFIGLAILFDLVFEFVKNQFRSTKSAYLILLVFGIGIYFSFFFPLVKPNQFQWRSERTNATLFLMNNVKENDHVLISCLFSPLGCWDYHVIINHYQNLGFEIKINIAMPTQEIIKSILAKKDINTIYWLVNGPIIRNEDKNLKSQVVWSESETQIFKLEKDKKWDQFTAYASNFRDKTHMPNYKNFISLVDVIIDLNNGRKADVLKTWIVDEYNSEHRDVLKTLRESH